MDNIQKIDNGGKRFWKDRRQFSYDEHLQERRRRNRRSGLERRHDQRNGIDTFQNIPEVS